MDYADAVVKKSSALLESVEVGCLGRKCEREGEAQSQKSSLD
jgi:hypothetical protein